MNWAASAGVFKEPSKTITSGAKTTKQIRMMITSSTHKANATIDANKKTVIISAPGVKAPIAARYGFRNFQIGNLQNIQGLPVLPFRTDK